MRLNSLHDLYVNEIKDLHHAENRIIKALPKIIEAATTTELRGALEQHLQATRLQIERLEQIFRRMNESPKGESCQGMQGILEEGHHLVNADAPDMVCDAGIISSAQRVEHYEIAAYGTVRTYARLLQETLNEEGEADKKLTGIAESRVNIEAARTA